MATVLVVVAGCATGRGRAPAHPVPSGWPVDPGLARISSPFGERRGGNVHSGIDLRAPKNTPVVATGDGVVTFAGRFGAYGRTVIVDHPDRWQTLYAHLRRIDVNEGDQVVRGDRVGRVGRSGNATGHHLHYEIRRAGRTIDPAPSLRIKSGAR